MKTLIIPFMVASLIGVAHAQTTQIRRDTVLEAVSEQDLSISSAREGDSFMVKLENDRDFPRGTRVIGEIERIEPARNNEPGYMDLVFTSVEYPGGGRDRIDAIPITLDAKGLERDRNGRLIANPKKVRTDQYVIGGAVGGLVIGALLKKPFEGAFVGTLAGILVGEVQRQDAKKKNDLVMQKGAKVGVLLQEDFQLQADDTRWGVDNGWNTPTELVIDDRDSKAEMYKDGAHWMISVSDVAKDLDIEVSRSGDRVWLEGDRGTARYTIGETDYRLNGRRGTFANRFEELNTRLYVPASLLAAVSSREIKIAGTRVIPVGL